MESLTGDPSLPSSLPFLQVFWPLSSWPPSWELFSSMVFWPLSSLASSPPVSSWLLSFSPPVCCCHRRQLVRVWARAWVWVWAQEVPGARPVQLRLSRVAAGRIPLPPPLPPRSPLPATRCMRRCHRILLRRHVRRAWGRRTSLLLLIRSLWRPGAGTCASWAAGTRNLKDHRDCCWNGGRL